VIDLTDKMDDKGQLKWDVPEGNWTHDFMESFKRLRGYDMTPFLPVLANNIVSSREISNRFL